MCWNSTTSKLVYTFTEVKGYGLNDGLSLPSFSKAFSNRSGRKKAVELMLKSTVMVWKVLQGQVLLPAVSLSKPLKKKAALLLSCLSLLIIYLLTMLNLDDKCVI